MDNQQKSLLEIDNLRWLRWFVIPRKMPDTFIGQQQAKQLTFYLFLLALVTFINFLMQALSGNITPFAIIGLVIGLGLYANAQFLYYKIAAAIASITTLVLPYALFIYSPQNVYPVTVFFLLMLSILIASQFLSLRSSLQIALLAFITAFFMSSIIIVGEPVSILNVLIPFIILTSLALLNTYGRERLIHLAIRNENPTQAIFLHNALSLMPDAAFIQVDKIIVETNDLATQLLGLSRAELIGQRASNFIPTGTSTNYDFDNNTDTLTVHYDASMSLEKRKQSVQVSVSSITYIDKSAKLVVVRPHQRAKNYALLEDIVNTSLNAIMVTDADLNKGPHIEMVNPAFCDMTGYSEAELLGRTPRMLQGLETDRQVLNNLRIALENGASQFRSEAVNYRKDGSPFRVLWLIRPVHNDEGDLTHYISIQQEISQQTQMQRDLQEREENLNSISEVMTDYAYMFEITADKTLQFTWITGAVEAITGLSYEEAMLLGDWRRIIHKDDQAFYDLRTRNLLDGKAHTLEYRIQDRDGSQHWIQEKAHPIIDETSGEVVRVLGAAHDITDHIEAQEDLKNYVVQQAVIAELGLLALNTNDIEELLDHIVVLCEQVLKVSFISIFEHDSTKERLTCLRISDNLAPFTRGESIVDDAKQSLAGYTLQSYEAIITDNFEAEDRFIPLPQIIDNNYKSAIGIVILGRTTAFGVLTAYSDLAEHFAYDELYFLQAIANILGTFIVRNQAQLAEQEQTEFAEALRDATSVINSRLELPAVLDKIITYVQQVVPQTQQASIMLRDEETQRYHYQTMWGFEEDIIKSLENLTFSLDELPILKLMSETAEPILISDIAHDPRWVIYDNSEPISSYLGAPIIVDDETIGFIDLYSYKIGVFSNKDAIRLKTFADKTSTAIVNARKQEDLEHKVAQRTVELKQEREQLQAIFAGTGDGIFYTEYNKIAFVNDALCQMTGYSSEELLGSNGSILQPSNISPHEIEKLMGITQTVLDTGIWRDTARLQRKDESTFEAGLTISSVETSETSVLRSVTIVRDMSREKELEDLKRTFIAAAAHDLRSPISSLKMRMYMIKKEPQRIDHHLMRVNEIINHVNHLVNDLLDAHGRIVLRPQTIILQDVLDKVVDILSLEAGVKEMIYDYHPLNSPAPILADENRLTQVFTNLIMNAIHYTQAKGHISIRTMIDEAAQIVEIRIEDSGVGISPDEQESIFLPFYRTHDNESKGNGLGLSITREIVELHKGQISVESVMGQGSTFIVTLPLVKTI